MTSQKVGLSATPVQRRSAAAAAPVVKYNWVPAAAKLSVPAWEARMKLRPMVPTIGVALLSTAPLAGVGVGVSGEPPDDRESSLDRRGLEEAALLLDGPAAPHLLEDLLLRPEQRHARGEDLPRGSGQGVLDTPSSHLHLLHVSVIIRNRSRGRTAFRTGTPGRRPAMVATGKARLHEGDGPG